jgi:hypothetical protein
MEIRKKSQKRGLVMLSGMKKSGKFQNNSQASKELTESLCVFAKQIGCPFTDFFSAQRRIYDWFRAEQ